MNANGDDTGDTQRRPVVDGEPEPPDGSIESSRPESSDEISEDGRAKRSRRFLLSAVATAVVVSTAGLSASMLVKSPQQVAAEAAPPKATVLSAEVERRVLKETMILRGTVAPGKNINVTPSAAGQIKPVVTRTLVKRGRRIRVGTVVIEVSGRPVIALYGKIPAYRDIRPDDKGPDVKQLQSALRMLGHAVNDPTGVFDSSTQAAVKKLYQARGYDAPTEQAESDAAPPEPTGSADRTTAGSKPKAPAKAPAKVYLPAGEVVFVSRFPARVTKVSAGLGSQVKGPALTLSTGDLAVRGVLPPVDRKLVKTQMKVTILSEESGTEVAGRVARIGELISGSAGGSEGAGEAGEDSAGSAPRNDSMPAEPGYPIVIRGNKPLPEAFAGQEVRLTIEAAATDGPVLVVPSSAIYAGADGSEQVLKLGPAGRRQRLKVTTGATGDGFVEIKSTGITDGDQVVVGK